MSFYPITKPPHCADHWAYWDGAFSESECYRIREMGEALIPKAAVIAERGVVEDYRRSKTSWIAVTNESIWLYDRIAWIARQLNGQYFGFDIDGFSEDLQYTVYEGEEQGYYDWHVDSGFNTNRPPRKLSFVVQLSSPDEYDGGELQILLGKDPFPAQRKLGYVVAFPSYTLHRVTPVTRGTRRSLVVWLSGPRFR